MSSFQKSYKVGWENHGDDHNPDFAVLALPAEIYATTHYGVDTLHRLESHFLAHLRARPDGILRGFLTTHSTSELFTHLCAPEAGLLVLHDRRRWNMAGFLLYFAGVSPGIRPEVAAAMRVHGASEGREESEIGYVEVCCIKRGSWRIAYPDLHARMVIDLRNRGVQTMYGIVHTENPSLRRHKSLGYEIVSGENPILLPVMGQGQQPSRYHLLRAEVDSPHQDRLIQKMHDRNLAFMNLNL